VPASPPPSEAERRQLTVMFCDLVGSTALSARFDPEELREEIRAYQNTVSGVVARYDGFVAKFMGDGVLAYFGYPRAHEDDAERAVRAGLEIAAAVTGLETRGTEPLAVRIGIEAILAPARIAETAPPFASLLSIPTGERYPPLALSAAQRRRLTLAALVDQLGAADPHRLLVVSEPRQPSSASSAAASFRSAVSKPSVNQS
jgi:hypothetical protein